MAISKTSKSEKTPSHPKYNEMIASAIRALKERSGSSRQAILKYVVAFYRIEDERRAGVHVKLALKRGVADGSLRQMKGSGASGSFRLAKENTKSKAKSDEKGPKVKKVVTKRPVVKKTATKKPVVKKTATKKPVVKKAATKKPVVKKTATPAKKTTTKKTTTVKKYDTKKATKTPKNKTSSKRPTVTKTAKAPVAKKLTKKNTKNT